MAYFTPSAPDTSYPMQEYPYSRRKELDRLDAIAFGEGYVPEINDANAQSAFQFARDLHADLTQTAVLGCINHCIEPDDVVITASASSFMAWKPETLMLINRASSRNSHLEAVVKSVYRVPTPITTSASLAISLAASDAAARWRKELDRLDAIAFGEGYVPEINAGDFIGGRASRHAHTAQVQRVVPNNRALPRLGLGKGNAGSLRKYNISQQNLKDILHGRNESLLFCNRCGKRIGKSQYNRTKGFCSNCFADTLEL